MANVELRLKVSKSAYEDKITKLDNYLGRLDTAMQTYERKKIELDQFMDGSDDNYETVKANIDANIATVKKAKEMTEASMKMLRDTLKEMEDFGTNIGKLATDALDTAKTTIKGAVEAMNLLT